MNAPNVAALETIRWHEESLQKKSYREQAREEIIERLVSGQSFRTVTARDIFDCAIDDEKFRSAQYHNVLDLLEGLLALSEKGGDDLMLDAHKVAQKAKEVIEAFVNGKPEWVSERADEIAADEAEDA